MSWSMQITNMLRRRFFGWAVLIPIGISTCAPVSAANTTVIPKIASFGIATVGVTTIEQLEAQLGPGRAYTGQHPRGAREWILKNSDWYIDADGFDYNQTGRVLNSLTVGESEGSDSSDSDGDPFAHVTRGSIVFLGSITLGMTEWKVKRLLKSHGVTTYKEAPLSAEQCGCQTVSGPAITITETGRAHLTSSDDYTTWTAEIVFERGRVAYIDLDCY
jgi:hypothetical protein